VCAGLKIDYNIASLLSAFQVTIHLEPKMEENGTSKSDEECSVHDKHSLNNNRRFGPGITGLSHEVRHFLTKCIEKAAFFFRP
jgi:hypothetical protein